MLKKKCRILAKRLREAGCKYLCLFIFNFFSKKMLERNIFAVIMCECYGTGFFIMFAIYALKDEENDTKDLGEPPKAPPYMITGPGESIRVKN